MACISTDNLRFITNILIINTIRCLRYIKKWKVSISFFFWNFSYVLRAKLTFFRPVIIPAEGTDTSQLAALISDNKWLRTTRVQRSADKKTRRNKSGTFGQNKGMVGTDTKLK